MSEQANIIKIKIPLTYLNEIIISIGIDRRQYHNNFKTVRTRTPYPIVFSGEESVRSSILVKPNAFAHPKTDKAIFVFENYASRVLVPDRIWWDTAHVIALYSTEPVLSNMFYAVKLKVPDEVREYAEKAFVLWLNTTWGMLTVLLSREETRGRWTSLKIGQWRLLKVLNVASLNNDILKKLEEIFDKYAKKLPRRIPEQFNPNNPDPVRLGIDRDFIKVFNPSLENEIIEEELMKLYNHIDIALKRWIGNNN